MGSEVVSVEHLYKQYRLGVIGHGTLRHDLQSWWARLRGKEDPNLKIDLSATPGQDKSLNRRFWALEDISFDVKQGEILGIIGRNGAGKSTLLKVMSRVTAPTKGLVKVKGRVASLLEVGTGFHPELTGRENIYLNGTILGMTKKEIDKKFDEIVDFAEIEEFIDTPVKRYSSGMYVRLAFAVAAHLEPEILIVDEVLAVGDVQFQKKCLGKMGDVAKEGRTVLFVSHNMSAINALCTRLILIKGGRVTYSGDVHQGVNSYLNDSSLDNTIDFEDDERSPIQIKGLSIKDEDGNTVDTLDYHKQHFVHIIIRVRNKDRDYYATMAIHDVLGNLLIFSADDDLIESGISGVDEGEHLYTVKLPPRLLKPGNYTAFITMTKRTHGNSSPMSRVRFQFVIEDNISRRAMRDAYRPAMVAPEMQWIMDKSSRGKG